MIVIQAATPLQPNTLTVTDDLGGITIITNPVPQEAGLGMEIWAAATNDRSGAEVVTVVGDGRFFHALPTGTDRWYWVRIPYRGGGFSEYYPTSSTGGVKGTALQAATRDLVPNAVTDFYVEKYGGWTWGSAIGYYGVSSQPTSVVLGGIPISGKGQWTEVKWNIDTNFGVTGYTNQMIQLVNNIVLRDVTVSADTVEQSRSLYAWLNYNGTGQMMVNFNNTAEMVAYLSADRNYEFLFGYTITNSAQKVFNIDFISETYTVKEWKR